MLKKLTAPLRPLLKSIRRPISRPASLAEGEENLDSESEVLISNFIDDDDS